MGTPQATDERRVPPRSRARAVALCLLVIVPVLGGALWAWEGVLKDRLVPKRWGVVEDGVFFRSGQVSGALIGKVLDRHGIAVVVDLTGEDAEDQDQAAEAEACRARGIERHRFALPGDGRGDLARYADALSVVAGARRAGRPVLVHCAAGSQRTGAAVFFYRVLVEGWDPGRAMAEMERYGWRPGRDHALAEYLAENLEPLGEMLRERGVIDRVPRVAVTMP